MAGDADVPCEATDPVVAPAVSTTAICAAVVDLDAMGGVADNTGATGDATVLFPP